MGFQSIMADGVDLVLTLRDRKHFLRFANAAQRVEPKREETATAFARRIVKAARNQYFALLRPAQTFDATRLVDSRANDREIEPLARTDVAVEHFA